MKIQHQLILIPAIICLLSCSKDTRVPIYEVLQRANFQAQLNGKQTDLYFLKNEDIHAAITNYGGRIVGLCVKNKFGEYTDVVLGLPSLEAYLNAKELYYGAIIGRVCNRIKNGRFELNDSTYQLPLNNGVNHIHGGPDGFHNVTWNVKTYTDSSLILSYLSKDGEMGYPGNLHVEVTYTLTANAELVINYYATTDKPTIVALTNHAFFNMGGEASGTIHTHELFINADEYTPVDSTRVPYNVNLPVENTPFDFRKAKPIGRDINSTHEQLLVYGGYGSNFALNKTKENAMTLAASVVERSSGCKMEIFTEEPAILLYGGNNMDGTDIGKYNKPFLYREAFCLETQHFIDAPNNNSFPSIVLNPEDTYRTTTVYKFSVID